MARGRVALVALLSAVFALLSFLAAAGAADAARDRTRTTTTTTTTKIRCRLALIALLSALFTLLFFLAAAGVADAAIYDAAKCGAAHSVTSPIAATSTACATTTTTTTTGTICLICPACPPSTAAALPSAAKFFGRVWNLAAAFLMGAVILAGAPGPIVSLNAHHAAAAAAARVVTIAIANTTTTNTTTLLVAPAPTPTPITAAAAATVVCACTPPVCPTAVCPTAVCPPPICPPARCYRYHYRSCRSCRSRRRPAARSSQDLRGGGGLAGAFLMGGAILAAAPGPISSINARHAVKLADADAARAHDALGTFPDAAAAAEAASTSFWVVTGSIIVFIISVLKLFWAVLRGFGGWIAALGRSKYF